MLVRIQSPEHGTKRVQTKPTERLTEFLEKVACEFSLTPGTFTIYQDRAKSKEITTSRSKTLNTCRIRHGDMLYLYAEMADVEMSDQTQDSANSLPGNSSALTGTSKQGSLGSLSGAASQGSHASLDGAGGFVSHSESPVNVVEDEIDQHLEKQDGLIYRKRNEQLCHHGPQGKCLHCVPLEPYDEQYLQSADPPIKFLSFHSHLRKLKGGPDKGKFAVLENISVKIKQGCTSHPPWPEGICTKCQPSAVTLNRQRYRHVDYVQFENPLMVDNFLNYWRTCGNQRIGMLYGKYEPYDKLPLGIQATVAAIYEPPQVSTRGSVELLEDERESIVKEVAAGLGLQCVGWIFTDLVPQDATSGTVKHFRGTIDTHFLSSEECILAAQLQNKHPSPSKLSRDGHFGSKFVTVVVTGDKENQIHFEGYQLSDQCMALVRESCLVPTLDAPELAYVIESSNKQYVPDVFYKVKDEYKNEVTKLARPLPVEYLLLDLQAAFPVEPTFTFTANASVKHFPIEQREALGEFQDFNGFSRYLSQFDASGFLSAMSDLHLLVYMATCDMLPVRNAMLTLLEAIKNKDETLARNWSKGEEWGTVEQLIAASEPSPGINDRQTSFVGPGADPLPPISGGANGGGAMWTCQHCTFHNNPSDSSCDMCGLPKS